jgi:hypothetical protein
VKKNRQSKTARQRQRKFPGTTGAAGGAGCRWGWPCSTAAAAARRKPGGLPLRVLRRGRQPDEIQTHSVYFEQKLIDRIIAKGELVYDGVSGATPVGTHYHGHAVMLKPPMFDIRRSINLEFDGRLATTPSRPALPTARSTITSPTAFR